jgi:hypothetical protein
MAGRIDYYCPVTAAPTYKAPRFHHAARGRGDVAARGKGAAGCDAADSRTKSLVTKGTGEAVCAAGVGATKSPTYQGLTPTQPP